jgi:hypothetical protein
MTCKVKRIGVRIKGRYVKVLLGCRELSVFRCSDSAQTPAD